jgi:hypothetical protein
MPEQNAIISNPDMPKRIDLLAELKSAVDEAES